MEVIDNLLVNEVNLLFMGLSEFFVFIQIVVDDLINLVLCDLVLSQGDVMLCCMSFIVDFMNYKEDEFNFEFESMVNCFNSLIQIIGDLNKVILVVKGNYIGGELIVLLNECDNVINEFVELMFIEICESSNVSGLLLVNLISGELLVLEDGSFNLFEFIDSVDVMYKQLQLGIMFEGVKVNINICIIEDDLGGFLGGLFCYCDEVLGLVQCDIGQLVVVFVDVVNSQNWLGMDFDFQLGGDIFILFELIGLFYIGIFDILWVLGQFIFGQGSEVIDVDIWVIVIVVFGGVFL